MAETEGGDMSRHAFQVAYHGTDPDDHTMEVEALGPALLAFGKLIREANTQINGDRSKVKVLVTSDFEHKCFSINFEVVQSIMHAIKSLLQDDNVETATKLLQTIGIIAGPSSLVGGSLLWFLKIKKGRKATEINKLENRDTSGDVAINIKIEGNDNIIQITNDVLKLSENPKILKALSQTLEPIETGSADRIEFRQAEKTFASYNRDETKAIILSCDAGPQDLIALDNEAPKLEMVTGSLYSYGPVYDNKAKTWRFKYNKKPVYVDISETDIAKDAMKRGGSFVNDRYRVRMEVTPPESEDGSPHYKIKQVLEFDPAPQQTSLAFRKPRASRKKRL
jgi:hypothetical protein